MKYLSALTRAHYESAPQMRKHSFLSVSASGLAINCKAYKEDCGKVEPENEALEFYALNHLASVIRKKFTINERLPEWAIDVISTYLATLSKQGQRLMFYMLLVTTRESRHIKNSTTEKFQTEFIEKFGKKCHEFNLYIKGESSSGAVEKFLKNPPGEVALNTYVDSLVHIFEHGSFSGGYGGIPWMNIAKTLSNFIKGETTLEMMVDTAYTLAHNNGPMFNKGMMYSMYSPKIYRVLDVQRSGQIPEMILNKEDQGLASGALRKLCTVVQEQFPEEFGSYVDWHKVEALGSLHKYPTDKQKQDKAHPPKPKEPPKSKEGYAVIGQWDVFPGQKVNILSRKK